VRGKQAFILALVCTVTGIAWGILLANHVWQRYFLLAIFAGCGWLASSIDRKLRA
jgi:hypothetical protein